MPGSGYMMQTSTEEKLLETLLLDLILLADRVGLAVNQAQSFKLQCRNMGQQVFLLSWTLQILRQYANSDPTMSLAYIYMNDPIHSAIRHVPNILQEAFSLASSCKRKTCIFGRLFTPKTAKFHQLYHLLDNSIDEMNWLVLLFNPDFGEMVSLFLPQILPNDASALSSWPCIDTEDMIWKLATMLTSETSPLELKLYCAEALSILNVGSILNKKATEEIEKLIICLAKLVEAEQDHELQCYCLTIIMKIISSAELNLDPRSKTFKTSTGAKGLIRKLSRLIEETEDTKLQILAIKYIGSLARTFYARNNRHVIKVLVSQLESKHPQVATEALVGLQKFVCPANFLCKEHSNRMVESNAVGAMVKLMRDGEERQQLQGLVLMCYIAKSADYSEAIEEARVATAIRQLTGKGSRTIVSQHPELKNLVSEALSSLNLYYQY